MIDTLFSDALPDPRIRIVRGAVVAGASGNVDVAHGVFDARRAFLPLSQARLSRGRFSGIPAYAAPSRRLRGTYLYGGLSHKHFGHFIIECLSRVWALGQMYDVPDQVDGIVFCARNRIDADCPLRRDNARALTRFCGEMPVRLIREATRIDRLILASPGFGHGPWLAGTAPFHAFMRNRLSDLHVDGADRLYLTRRYMTGADQIVDQEDKIEAMMEQAGYFILAPEKFHLDVQLGAMRAARQIVGADGSAFHLLPFAMQPQARAAIFLRRNRPEMLTHLANQMQGFVGVTPLTIDARARPITKASPAPLDLNALRSALQAGGFL